jgi:hypothetical protein
VGKLDQQRERLVWGNRTVLVVHRERQQTRRSGDANDLYSFMAKLL